MSDLVRILHHITYLICLVVLLSPLVTLGAEDPPTKSEPMSDPLAPILGPHLKPTVAILLDHYRANRKYVNSDFPMPRDKFARFKAEIRAELACTLGISDWVVRSPAGKKGPIADQFEDRVIETIGANGHVE